MKKLLRPFLRPATAGYLILALGTGVALYEEGPARRHRECVSANERTLAIRKAFHDGISSFGDNPKVAATDRKVQRGLRKGAPLRDC